MINIYLIFRIKSIVLIAVIYVMASSCSSSEEDIIISIERRALNLLPEGFVSSLPGIVHGKLSVNIVGSTYQCADTCSECHIYIADYWPADSGGPQVLGTAYDAFPIEEKYDSLNSESIYTTDISGAEFYNKNILNRFFNNILVTNLSLKDKDQIFLDEIEEYIFTAAAMDLYEIASNLPNVSGREKGCLSPFFIKAAKKAQYKMKSRDSLLFFIARPILMTSNGKHEYITDISILYQSLAKGVKIRNKLSYKTVQMIETSQHIVDLQSRLCLRLITGNIGPYEFAAEITDRLKFMRKKKGLRARLLIE